MTRDGDFKRLVRARMAKTGESYATAHAHLRPATGGGSGGTLHVTNGDATVRVLRAAGVTETVLPWRDVLHSGPVPAVPGPRLREIRARHLAGGAREAEVLAFLADRDRIVRDHRGDFRLWFEADLYDQLQLVQILSVLHDNGVDPGRITLICIGEFPGIGHFGGLGELSAEQLGGLRDTGAPLSAAAVELGRHAWTALCAPEPTGYAAIARAVSGELRFVPEAFDRLGREFPSTRDGLSLTERRLLAALVDGELTAGEAFVRGAAREIRPFLGDTTCFDLLADLATGDRPLVRLDRTTDPDTPRHWRVALTDDGRRVLAGAADRLDLIGLDRWIGGVHLTAGSPSWRWDEGTETLVRHPTP